MAIIRLNGADFSKKYIKNIEIFKGFSAITKSVFSQYGIIADTSNLMQRAVNDFVNTLVINEIWGNGKIIKLCLPFLAELGSNDKTDAIKDVMSGEPFMNNESSLSFTRHGLIPIVGKNISRVSIPIGVNIDNIHIAAYPLEEEPVDMINDNDVLRKALFGSSKSIYMLKNVGAEGFWLEPNYYCTFDLNYQYKSCMIIGSIGSDYIPNLYMNGQQTTARALSETSGLLDTIPIFTYGNGTAKYEDNSTQTNFLRGTLTVPVGLLSIGGNLTTTESAVYTTAANTLIEAVNKYL